MKDKSKNNPFWPEKPLNLMDMIMGVDKLPLPKQLTRQQLIDRINNNIKWMSVEKERIKYEQRVNGKKMGMARENFNSVGKQVVDDKEALWKLEQDYEGL